MVQGKLYSKKAAHCRTLCIRGVQITQWSSSNCSLVYIWIDLQQVQFSEIRTDYCCSSNKSNKMTTDVHVWECFFDAQEHLEHARYKAEKVREKEVLDRKHITSPKSIWKLSMNSVAWRELQGKHLQENTFNRCLKIYKRYPKKYFCMIE